MLHKQKLKDVWQAGEVAPGHKVKLYRQARQEPRWFARWTVTCGSHSISWTTLSISYVQMAVKLNGVRGKMMGVVPQYICGLISRGKRETFPEVDTELEAAADVHSAESELCTVQL